MIPEEQAKLSLLIQQGEINEALEYLQQIKKRLSQSGQVDALTSRYNRLKREEQRGILSAEQIMVAKNQIVDGIIDLIDQSDEVTAADSSAPSAQTQSSKSKIWKYITVAAVLIGILGSLAEVFNFINLIPSNNEVLQLTVFVTDTKGNVVLENEGRLNIPLGNRSLNEVIGANGRTNFPDITGENKGDTITIGLQAEGWEIVDGKNTFVFTGEPIRLRVKKDDSLGIIKGVVKTRDGQNFIEGAKILINTDTTILSNENGVFNIILPERMRVGKDTDGYKLTITKEDFKTKTQYFYPNSTPADIRLEKQN